MGGSTVRGHHNDYDLLSHWIGLDIGIFLVDDALEVYGLIFLYLLMVFPSWGAALIDPIFKQSCSVWGLVRIQSGWTSLTDFTDSSPLGHNHKAISSSKPQKHDREGDCVSNE